MKAMVLVTAVLGALASAAVVLGTGGGVILAFVAYALGGAFWLLTAATLHVVFPEGPHDTTAGGPTLEPVPVRANRRRAR